MLSALSLLLGSTDSTAAASSEKPNIVFLLADNLGASDRHCYGQPYSRTPNIDSLATDGTRFTQYQATGATCCPTRTGLMISPRIARAIISADDDRMCVITNNAVAHPRHLRQKQHP